MIYKSKKLGLTAAVALAMATMGTGLAQAADAAPEAKPDNEISYNAALASDYRYRGISQSRLDPALQGGADFSAGGFYIGTWASTIKWIKDIPGGNSSVEVDVYERKSYSARKRMEEERAAAFIAEAASALRKARTPTAKT